MDLNDLRVVITAVSFLVFAGIVYWAYSSRQQARFKEAANLPFLDSDLPGETAAASTEDRVGDRT